LAVRPVALLVALSLLTGCGSSPEPPPASPDQKQAKSRPKGKSQKTKAASPAQDKFGLPARCEKKRWPCLPPPQWVAKLCEDVYPDVALHMFAPRSPWQRFYMLKNAEPFNASGGASLMGDKMRRGEEVIALRRHNARSGFSTSDIGGYDVLRWNGACATVHDGEFQIRPLSDVSHARLEWRGLGLPIRQALEADSGVSATYEERRRQCKGISIGRVSADCEDYTKKLVDEVVRYVRDGGSLPKPAKQP
jgi:hypothetical protein